MSLPGALKQGKRLVKRKLKRLKRCRSLVKNRKKIARIWKSL